MYVCVCVCVYVCVCISIYMCVCIHIYICVCVYPYIYVCVSIYICVCIHIYMCVCVCVCVYPMIIYKTAIASEIKLSVLSHPQNQLWHTLSQGQDASTDNDHCPHLPSTGVAQVLNRLDGKPFDDADQRLFEVSKGI